MISDIFITVPCLVMTTIAWYIRAGIALTCLIVLFAVAIGAVSVMYSTPAPIAYRQRPEPLPQP